MYISANSGDPGQSDSKKSYFIRLVLLLRRTLLHNGRDGGCARLCTCSSRNTGSSAPSPAPSWSRSRPSVASPATAYRFRRRSSCRSSEPASRDASPIGKSGYTGPAAADISMYTLSRDSSKAAMGALLNSEREFLQAHNSNAKDFKDAANRRTTPVWENLSTEEVPRPRRYNHRLELDPSRKKKNSLEACRAITLFL